jgi:hypothetical protein
VPAAVKLDHRVRNEPLWMASISWSIAFICCTARGHGSRLAEIIRDIKRW